MSRNPIEELGEFFDNTIRGRIRANEAPTLELGTINGNMALQVDSLSNAIPKGEYMVSLKLTIGSLTVTSETADAHTHRVTLPGALRGLKAGDRVLVAWAGMEPVVIDVVASS